MIGPFRYIFGYAVITLEKTDIPSALTKLCVARISFDALADGRIVFPLWALTRVKKLLSDYKIIELSRGGLPIKLRKLFGRWGIIAAIIVFVFFEILSSLIVWDVRIVGEVSDEEGELIKEELSSSGLSVGALWHRLDKNKVEESLLFNSELVGWLNINRRGTVAYVSVVKKDIHKDEDNIKTGYSSIVAARDCVIEDILVKNGIALVEKGESVRRGQVLISGVIPTDKGGGYLYAEGKVIGSFSEKLSIRVEGALAEKVYIGEPTRDLSINFFGKDINIFKKFGNCTESCDIIEEKEDVYILGVRLPISYTVRKIQKYELRERRLTELEMARLAREKLSSCLRDRLGEGELISLISRVNISDSAYQLEADIVICENIAENKEFQFIVE